jgi:predicted dithiol-disulfide oxidoreductase (DUF899 family)
MGHHDIRFPNEDESYRAARDELLGLEIDLRERLSRVAALRQKLPLGGLIPEDYRFNELGKDGARREIKLSELFLPGQQTLALYSFMYGPDAAAPCPACTSLIDGLDGSVHHITQRLGFAVVARSPIERFNEHAKSRGWSRARLLSSSESSYNHDYHAENQDGSQNPAMNVFVLRSDGIHHFYSSELLYAELDGHPRHMDLMWPIWNVFDLTPEGRGEDWFPKLQY